MPSQSRPSKKVSSSRDFDRESGKNRLSSGKKHQRRPPPPESESEELTSDDSDSEVEKILSMNEKDDSRRSKAPKQKVRSTKRSTPAKDVGQEQDDTNESSTDATTVPALFMLAMTLHCELTPVVHAKVSEYIPYTGNLFAVLRAVQNQIVDNTHLRRIKPDYFTPCSTLYYSYLVYYQILRAREYAVKADRHELRALKRMSQVLKPEECIIAGPLVPFFEALASVKPADPKYNYIVPKFPNFAAGTNPGAQAVEQIPGASRLPFIIGLLDIINRMGRVQEANRPIVNGAIMPFSIQAHDATNNNTWLAADIRAISQNVNTFKDAISSVISSAGWIEPADMLLPTGDYTELISRRLRNQGFPCPSDTTIVNSLSGYLMILDGDDLHWMKILLLHARVEAQFCKGSTTLASIAPNGSIGIITETKELAASKTALPNPSETYIRNPHAGRFSAIHRFGGTTREEFKHGVYAQVLHTFAPHSVPHAKFERASEGPYFEAQTSELTSLGAVNYELSSTGSFLPRAASLVASMIIDVKGEQN